MAGRRPADPLVYLASESPAELTHHFPARRILHAGLLPNLPPVLAFALDFHVMAQADALAISNSSFSFMAAMLNDRARIFVRPTLEDRRLVPFDPWDAPVLLPRRLVPGEQEELDAMDRAPGPFAGMGREEPRWPPADAAMIEAISGRERGPRGGHFFPRGRAVSAAADWIYHIVSKI